MPIINKKIICGFNESSDQIKNEIEKMNNWKAIASMKRASEKKKKELKR